MNNTETKAPGWLIVIGVLALLWNLMGVYAFYGDMTISAEQLAEMTPALKEWYETNPIWVKMAYGGAVIFGALGSIGLILKKRWSSILLGLSLVCVLVQMAHSFMNDGYEIAGEGAMTMSMVILAGAAFLALFSRWANSKNYLS